MASLARAKTTRSSITRLAADSCLTVAEVVEDCERVRTALGIERWTVIGQSFGGHLALRYALRWPGHVHAVVFENPSFNVDSTSKTPRRTMEPRRTSRCGLLQGSAVLRVVAAGTLPARAAGAPRKGRERSDPERTGDHGVRTASPPRPDEYADAILTFIRSN